MVFGSTVQCTYQCQVRGGSVIGWPWVFRHFLKTIIKIHNPGQKIIVNSISNKWSISCPLFLIERSNDQNPHPGDTRRSQFPVLFMTEQAWSIKDLLYGFRKIFLAGSGR